MGRRGERREGDVGEGGGKEEGRCRRRGQDGEEKVKSGRRGGKWLKRGVRRALDAVRDGTRGIVGSLGRGYPGRSLARWGFWSRPFFCFVVG